MRPGIYTGTLRLLIDGRCVAFRQITDAQAIGTFNWLVKHGWKVGR
jgi:hypothetical protein